MDYIYLNDLNKCIIDRDFNFHTSLKDNSTSYFRMGEGLD